MDQKRTNTVKALAGIVSFVADEFSTPDRVADRLRKLANSLAPAEQQPLVKLDARKIAEGIFHLHGPCGDSVVQVAIAGRDYTHTVNPPHCDGSPSIVKPRVHCESLRRAVIEAIEAAQRAPTKGW